MNLFGLYTKKQAQRMLDSMLQEVTTNLYNTNVYQWIGDGQPIYEEDRFDFVRQGFMAVPAMFECVDLLYKKIAAASPIVYEVRDEKSLKQYKQLIRHGTPEAQFKAMQLKSTALAEVDVPRIRRLLENPNPDQTWNEFIRHLAGMYLIRGNSYMYGNSSDNGKRLWSELFSLPPLHIISGGVTDPVKEYFLNYGSETQQNFPAPQIYHFKTFNPDFTSSGSQLYGMPILRAYIYAIRRAREGNNQINKQFKNGGTFGLLAPKNREDQFSAPQKTALKEMLVGAHASEEFLSRILPSSVAMEFLKLGLSPADLDLFKGIELTDEEIYRAYHIPLTYRSMEGSTFNNKSSDGKSFIYNAVAPHCEEFSDGLTKFICDPYYKETKKKYIIRLAYEDLPELAADMKETSEWLNNSWWLTPNERREVMNWGRSEEPNMDSIWIPSGFRPIQDAGLSAADFGKAFDDLGNEV